MVEFSALISSSQKTFSDDLIYNVPPHPPPTLCHSLLVLLWFIFPHSTDHHLTSDMFLCLLAYCLLPPHSELRSGTLFCSLLRKYLKQCLICSKDFLKIIHASHKYLLSAHFSFRLLGDDLFQDKRLVSFCTPNPIGSSTQSTVLKGCSRLIQAPWEKVIN